jgi:hypothetical protein
MKSLKLKFKIFFVQNASTYVCFITRTFPTRIHNTVMRKVFAAFHVEIETKSEFLILTTWKILPGKLWVNTQFQFSSHCVRRLVCLFNEITSIHQVKPMLLAINIDQFQWEYSGQLSVVCELCARHLLQINYYSNFFPTYVFSLLNILRCVK